MHEIARWELDRLYSDEDIIDLILEWKEKYFVTKDIDEYLRLM